MFRKMTGCVLAFVSTLVLGGCVAPEAGSDTATRLLPANPDEAAQFLAGSAHEHWVVLLANDGVGNTIYVNKGRIDTQPNGVERVWLRMVFPQAMPLSAQDMRRVAQSLILTEVNCQDNTYRSSAFYAVGEDQQVLDIVHREQEPFVPMDAGATALGLFRLACEAH